MKIREALTQQVDDLVRHPLNYTFNAFKENYDAIAGLALGYVLSDPIGSTAGLLHEDMDLPLIFLTGSGLLLREHLGSQCTRGARNSFMSMAGIAIQSASDADIGRAAGLYSLAIVAMATGYVADTLRRLPRVEHIGSDRSIL